MLSTIKTSQNIEKHRGPPVLFYFSFSSFTLPLTVELNQ